MKPEKLKPPKPNIEREIELADALMDMVNQHFHTDNKGRLWHNALSSNELAIEILLEVGLAKKVLKHKECYRLNWKKIAELKKQVGL